MAPAVGQHSAEILHEVLHYSEERIAELEFGDVIG
jgi:crotonobetainyl-CoA:carnitine CoA-transferase CaiB-like acyl-CoA transferase